MNARLRRVGALCWVALLWAVPLKAQREDYGSRLGRIEAGQPIYYSSGTGLRMEAVYPSLQKWYLPQEIAGEYRRQWSYTNYARDPYRRYLDPGLEGGYFYDLYGRFLNKGWLVYDWRQIQPTGSGGSGILQAGQYGSWFSNLVLAGDTKGQHYFSVLIGDEIFAMLTPMTFRKTAYNGVMFNYAADRLTATVLMSRINLPLFRTDPFPVTENNFTNLIGGRVVWDLGNTTRLGGTFLNAHNGRTASDRFEGHPLKGKLTSGQLDGRIDRIVVRLTDDSPEDEGGGAVLFSSDIEIETRIGERDTLLIGSQIGFAPRIIGGVERGGFLTAEGRGEASQILLEYVFSDDDPAVSDLEAVVPSADLVNQISRVRFRLVLGNDYKVEVTSNRQTDNSPSGEQPQFRTVARAEGNVWDNSNQRTVVFDYGLPTATQVAGLTLQGDDWAGFRVYGEFNVNHQFTQYPTRTRDTHKASSGIGGDRAALGWMFNISRRFAPFFFFGEAFGLDAEYYTSPRFVDSSGRVDWSNDDEARARHVYDFVDDNDDNDRINDQKRRFDDGRTGDQRGVRARTFEGFADDAVFPGLDENNDFISDFNQNDLRQRPNFLPDYEEPFLRYNVDRPEYLFALDLNNNGWGDRFENDEEPDYPYRRDRRGYNAYLSAELRPELKLTTGQVWERKPTTGARNRTYYALLAYEQSFAGLGTLTAYNSFKWVADAIAEDLVQWIQLRPVLGRPSNSPGSMTAIRDPLGMGDALVNKLWIGAERRGRAGFQSENKLLYEFIQQRREDAVDRDGRRLQRNTRRLGLINKAEYPVHLGRITALPRLKQELFMDDTPFNIERQLGTPTADRRDWSTMASVLVKVPFMKRSVVQLGVEHLRFRDMVVDETAVTPGDPTGDYDETSFAVQLSNTTSYLGYKLMSQVGLRIDKRQIERAAQQARTETSGLTFVTVQAGLSD